MAVLLALLLASLFGAVPALADDRGDPPIVGVLRLDTPQTVARVRAIFLAGLKSRGYVDGRDIRVRFYLAEGRAERFPELARALVRENPRVIVASGDAAVRAAQQATRTIPIIGVVDDIVGAGLIDSMAKPGGNITGISILASELDAKRLEILKQAIASDRRVAVLSDPASATARPELLRHAAPLLGLELDPINVRNPEEFEPAFAAAKSAGDQAMLIRSSPLLFAFRHDLCALSRKHGLPVIGQFREMPEAGCLMSYGVTLSEMHDLAADLTVGMLKGGRPGETPARQPTHYELVVNTRTAKTLGVSIPAALLARAETVE